jgi:hypothetical protein
MGTRLQWRLYTANTHAFPLFSRIPQSRSQGRRADGGTILLEPGDEIGPRQARPAEQVEQDDRDRQREGDENRDPRRLMDAFGGGRFRSRDDARDLNARRGRRFSRS